MFLCNMKLRQRKILVEGERDETDMDNKEEVKEKNDQISREEPEESWLLAGAWTPEFGEHSLLQWMTDHVKRICCIIAMCAVCLCVMKVGDGEASSSEEKGNDVEELIDDFIEAYIQKTGGTQSTKGDAGDSVREEQTRKTLNITIIDEFPPESELEVRIIGENGRNTEEESDSVFSQMTNIVNIDGDEVWLIQADGSAAKEEGSSIWLNTAMFFVPDGGSRGFGIPNFSTEIYGEGEWEARRELDEKDLIGDDCGEFNDGIDATRQLMAAGYLNDEIARLLERFPEIRPYDREYTLRLVNAGETLREEDQTGWWDVDYALYTEADTGEELMLVYIDITRVTLAQGEVWDWDDAQYRIDVAVENLWQLLEDPVNDKGEVWMQQIMGDSVANEDAIVRFVEEYGTQIVIPRGADTEVGWNCHREERYYYDYLVWQGETTDYTVTLAVPIMGKRDEGYYMASRIRKEASDKETCYHILSGMMQTFQGVPYLHVVKEGESLAKIAERYSGVQSNYVQMRLYDEKDGSMIDFDNPDRIYPGQKVSVPFIKEYDGRDVKNLD